MNMNKLQKTTTEDGWGCVPELKDVARIYDRLSHQIYEIKHCVRVSSTEEIVTELRLAAEDMIRCLDYIDTDVDYVTADSDNEE